MNTSRATLAALACLLSLAAPANPGEPLETALATIRSVGPEGAGNLEASRAWSTIAQAEASRLPSLLLAMNGADARACNYLFAAATAIADRHLPALRDRIPVTALGEFLLDTSHDPRPRRLAYELLVRVDPALARALLVGLLDDPATELRREAVQQALQTAAQTRDAGRAAAAAVLYRQALGFARDADQIEAISGPLKDLGQPVDLVHQLGFLTRWTVIGPFDNTGGEGFARVFPPETEVQLDAVYDGKQGPVRWKPFVSDHPRGMVDLNKAFAPLKEVTGYAFTEFHSDAARPAELRLGCKNGWKLWFNGRFLFGRDEYHRAAEIDQYRFPVELRPGRNTLLVKLTQNEQVEEWTVEWEFQLRVTDPTGRVLRSRPPEAPMASVPLPHAP